MKQVVAFSGGKDSTALVLRMAELGEDFECLFTPTGNEPADCIAHIAGVIERIQRPLVTPPNKGLFEWIDFHQALPNWRMRWCTRQIKIEPCIAYLKSLDNPVLCVGLRADEESREGLYGDFATYRYPLREWGWELQDVIDYCADQGVKIPERTDCLLCYGQRLSEWYRLWRDRPQEFQRGVDLEQKIGRTFRSAQRDTWPAALSDLRDAFIAGRVPRGVGDQTQSCRVCQL